MNCMDESSEELRGEVVGEEERDEDRVAGLWSVDTSMANFDYLNSHSYTNFILIYCKAIFFRGGLFFTLLLKLVFARNKFSRFHTVVDFFLFLLLLVATITCYIKPHNHIKFWRGEGASVRKAYNGRGGGLKGWTMCD